MSKKVVWKKPESLHNPQLKKGQYRSFKELMQKRYEVQREQDAAQEYLRKASPAMVKLLEMRLESGEPLKVMRPIRYKTSRLNTELQKAEDDGFYQNSASDGRNSRFVDVEEIIYPGTQLVLKSLDAPMQEFIFEDGTGKEHALNFSYRNQLMTQTDVFETVKQLLEEGTLQT